MNDGDSTPYGLRDVKITPFTDAAGTILADTSIDLPISQTFSFTDTENFNELRGDDKSQAQHGDGSVINWELDSGGLSFAAVQAMYGGTITTTGVAPDVKTRWTKKVTDQRPYFRVEGQVISDSGGDLRCVVKRCKATGDFNGSFADGAFWITQASGVGMSVAVGTDSDELYYFEQSGVVTEFVEPSVGA